MSEYKFVQWGKGVPVDYQRLGQMVSNEQYLKDIADNTPRGVLAWKSVGGTTYGTPTGAAQDVSGLTNITFDVGEDRLIKFRFESGRIAATSLQVEVRFSLLIDNVNTGDISGTVVGAGAYVSPVCYSWIPTVALSKGTHTVSAQFVSNNAASGLKLGETSRCFLEVVDEGKFISASS